MTNVEYIFEFANKHDFPKSECEVMFNAVDDGSGNDIYTTDYDIIAVKFDESIVNNEIKMEDIRFDIDSNFPEDVFFMWQKDMPDVSFRTWISLGRYVPTIIQNTEFFDELEMLTKEIEMKLESVFSIIEEGDDGDSDYYDENSDYDGEGED
jgi:hypothetical protein